MNHNSKCIHNIFARLYIVFPNVYQWKIQCVKVIILSVVLLIQHGFLTGFCNDSYNSFKKLQQSQFY